MRVKRCEVFYQISWKTFGNCLWFRDLSAVEDLIFNLNNSSEPEFLVSMGELCQSLTEAL